MADIFLSYSSKDRNRLRPLVEALLGSGLTVFWDRDIPPGSTWRSVLDRELRTAAWVIVIWSRSSVESEWVLEEAQDAKTRGILLPASIDRIDPPIGFRAIQSADLKDWKGDPTDPFLSAFVAAAAARVRGEAVPPAPASRAIRPRRWMAAAAGVLLLLVSGALLFRGTIQGHAPTISPATDAGKPTQAADPRPLAPPAASYRRVFYENFEQAKTVPTSVFLVGRRAGWEGSVAHGKHRLCNRTREAGRSHLSTFTYLDGKQRPLDQSLARIEMTVRLEPPLSKHAGAGIMYRASGDGYYAFALSAGHSVTWLRGSGNRIRILATWNLDGFEDGLPARLKAEAAADGIHLFINDKAVHRETAPESRAGRTGVFAMGTGCFFFDDVTLHMPDDAAVEPA